MRRRSIIAARRTQQGDRRLGEALPALAQVISKQLGSAGCPAQSFRQ
jgi:hypothetical protein